MSAPCIICGNTQNNTSFEVQEHQMGIGHLFHYQQCGACHSAQLLDPPADFAPYYQNDNYYSFHLELRLEQNIVRKIQTGHILFGKYPIIGHLLTLGYTVNEFIDWMKNLTDRLHFRTLPATRTVRSPVSWVNTDVPSFCRCTSCARTRPTTSASS